MFYATIITTEHDDPDYMPLFETVVHTIGDGYDAIAAHVNGANNGDRCDAHTTAIATGGHHITIRDNMGYVVAHGVIAEMD